MKKKPTILELNKKLSASKKNALVAHKAAHQPIVVSRAGKIVFESPEPVYA